MAFIHDGPTLAKLQFNLALAYHRTGQSKLAIEWLEEALRNTGGDFPKASSWIVRIRGDIVERKAQVSAESAPLDWDSNGLLDSLADSLQKFMDEA